MVKVDCAIILIDFVHGFLFYTCLGIPKIVFVFASCPERLFQLSCMGNSIDKYKKEKKESTDGILFVGMAFIAIGIFSSSSCRRLFLSVGLICILLPYVLSLYYKMLWKYYYVMSYLLIIVIFVLCVRLAATSGFLKACFGILSLIYVFFSSLSIVTCEYHIQKENNQDSYDLAHLVGGLLGGLLLLGIAKRRYTCFFETCISSFLLLAPLRMC